MHKISKNSCSGQGVIFNMQEPGYSKLSRKIDPEAIETHVSKGLFDTTYHS